MEDDHVETSSQLTAAVLLALGTLPSALPTQSAQPSDMLLLTGPEKRLAWRDLHTQTTPQYEPPGFETIDHWVLPETITAKPITTQVARDVPLLKSYNFALVGGRLLIVNPLDRVIAEVIRPYRSAR